MLGSRGADIVLFAIQAGVRLFGAVRQGYVDRTRERALTLPLPGLSHRSTAEDALVFFFHTEPGIAARALDERASDLAARADAGGAESLGSEERDELLWRYELHRSRAHGTPMADGLRPEDAVAALTIRHWNATVAPPRAFQRVAATLVEIGVDYFASGPGAGRLAGERPAKAVLRSLLDVLDRQELASVGLDGLFEGLFVATLEALADNPALATGDEQVQLLVAGIARGLAEDVDERLRDLDDDTARVRGARLSSLAGLVFRSVVRSGAEVVLAHPGTFLGRAPDTGHAELMTRIGRTLLDIVLAEDEDGVALDALFTSETLDAVVRAALAVVAEHPDVLGLTRDGDGIHKALREVIAGLAASTRKVGKDMLAELARLVLERTGANLQLIWGEGEGAEYLALVAARAVLDELARPPEAGRWRPRLSRSQVLLIVEAVLDEVADNPQLVVTEVDGAAVLQEVLRVVLEELADKQLAALSGDAVVAMLRVAVAACAERWAFMERMPGEAGRTALAAVLDALFTAAVDPARDMATWTMAKGSVLVALLELTLEKLGEKGVTQRNLAGLREVIEATQADIEAGCFSLERFLTRLEEQLVETAGAA